MQSRNIATSGVRLLKSYGSCKKTPISIVVLLDYILYLYTITKRRELYFFKDYFEEFYNKQTNKVQKKSQKTPRQQIEQAEQIKREYYDNKE